MKSLMPLLQWLFTAIEIGAQILISPFVLLTAVALLLATKLIGRQVRKAKWRNSANWQSPSPGARVAT